MWSLLPLFLLPTMVQIQAENPCQDAGWVDFVITCDNVTAWDQLDVDILEASDPNPLNKTHPITVLRIFESDIPNYSFGSLNLSESLSRFQISNSIVGHLSDETFKGLPALRELVLYGNTIKDVEVNAFASLRSLRSLQMSNNKMVMDVRSLRPLGALKELYFRESNVEGLDSVGFDVLEELESLDVSFCNISEPVAELFAKPSALKSLYLKGNNITKLFSSCHAHQLENLPCTFKNLPHVTTLDLSFNSISHMDPNVFKGLRSLAQLYLYQNKIKTFNGSVFNGLEKLSALSLNDNAIEALKSGQFESLKNLSHLYLQRNALKDVQDGSFKGLANLRLLVLKMNEIEALSCGTFRYLENLQHLDLASNKISRVGARAFEPLRSLDVLILKSNKLMVVPEDAFLGLKRLRAVDLRDNQLRSLWPDAFVGSPGLVWIRLQGNKMEANVGEKFYDHQEFCRSAERYDKLLASDKEFLCSRF